MTTQEAFDKVLTEIRGRGYMAAMPPAGLRCVNVAEDGSRCAVALLLPDIDNETMTDTADDMLVSMLACSPAFPRSLRAAHDYWLGEKRDPRNWEDDMRITADDFELAYTPPTEPL